MSLEKNARTVRLTDLETNSRKKENLAILVDNCRQTHAAFGLALPYTNDDFATRPLVMAGEQLGVEIRPATVQKILILSILAKKKGFIPIFLLEDRDVISKAAKLTSWAFPSTKGTPEGDLFSRIYFDGLSTSESKQLPLKYGVIKPNVEAIYLQIRSHYEGVVEEALRDHLNLGLKDIADLLSESLAVSNQLAHYGQRQLLSILERLSIDNVVFSNLGLLEDSLSERGIIDALFTGEVRERLTQLKCVPEGSDVLWGEHRGDCHGRVHITVDQQAKCLRCGGNLAPEDWKFLSLRAIPRMLVIASFGVDLFVIGGTSEYNLQVLELFQSLGRPMFPMIWKSGVAYAGPFQDLSDPIKEASRSGKYTFLDALIGHNYSFSQSNPLAGAEHSVHLARSYDLLSQAMIDDIDASGVSLVS